MARPRIVEGEKVETLAITLPTSLKEKLADASWNLRLSRSEITRQALAEWLSNNNGKRNGK